ncbi:MAG: biopolymer transporter ExbD [Prevotella sp.]|nr:biopolymer transporter ExbD [Prevotella sp.]
MIRRRNRETPSLDMTSTADISFMLLIFFLMVSSMDVDRGITRLLPPSDDKKQEMQVEREKLIALGITAENRLTLNGEPVDMAQIRPRVASLVIQIGEEHLISIESDTTADYNTYFELQNEIAAAYRDVRKRRPLPQRIADVVKQ